MKFLSIFLVLGIGSASADNSSELEQATQRVVQAKEIFDSNHSVSNKRNLDSSINALALLQNNNNKTSHSNRAQVSESEPNDTFGNANALTANDSGTGSMTPAADRDFWSVSGVSSGDVVFVTIDTASSTTSLDTEMSVVENDGSTLIEFDDDSGDGLSSSVVAAIPTAGSIFFEFNEFGDDGEVTPYEVFQSVQSAASTTAETEPNDDFMTASPASKLMNTGDIASTVDFFSFQATAGDRLAVIVDNDPDGNAMNANVEVAVIDTDGSTVLANEAPFSATGQNVAVATIVNTGTNFVQLTDASGDESNYRFVIVGSSGTVPVELQSFSIE